MTNQNSVLEFDFKSLVDSKSELEFTQYMQEFDICLSRQEASSLHKMFARPLTLTEALIFSVYFKHIRINDSLHKLLKNLPTQGRYVFSKPEYDLNLIEIAEVEGQRYLLSLEQASQSFKSGEIHKQNIIQDSRRLDTKVMNKNLSIGADSIAAIKVLSSSPAKDIAYRYKFRMAHKHASQHLSDLGIPYINGKVQYADELHQDFIQNTLHLGLLREDELVPQVLDKAYLDKQYSVILVGKSSDLSGFEQSSIARSIQDQNSSKQHKHLEDPFYDNHFFLATRDLLKHLKSEDYLSKISLRTVGTGGIVTALLKQLKSSGRGAKIQVDLIPSLVEQKAITLCSSTNGRLLFLVPKRIKKDILSHYNESWEFSTLFPSYQAIEIGELSTSKTVDIVSKQGLICSLPLTEFKYEESLTNEDPDQPSSSKGEFQEGIDLSDEEISEAIQSLVKQVNFLDHQPLIQFHNTTVQGSTIIQSGQAEAGLIAPLQNRLELCDRSESKIGIAVSTSLNFSQSKRLPKHQAALSVLQSMRKVASIGATPWSISDSLNYKDFDAQHQAARQTQSIAGLSEALRVIGHKNNQGEALPCISGTLLNPPNKCAHSTDLNVAYGTTLVSVLGKISDYQNAISSDIKDEKSTIFLIGARKPELGASLLFQILKKDISEGSLPSLDYEEARKEIFTLVDAINSGLVLAAHSIAEGGMIAALLKMFLISENEIGANLEFPTDSIGLSFAEKLFSETGGFICQVSDSKAVEFELFLKEASVNTNILGHLDRKSTVLKINSLEIDLSELEETYKESLSSKI